VPWPADGDYAAMIRSLDPKVPAHAALLIQSARLFRGAGYVAFTDGAPVGDAAVHAAVASTYAHCPTASRARQVISRTSSSSSTTSTNRCVNVVLPPDGASFTVTR